MYCSVAIYDILSDTIFEHRKNIVGTTVKKKTPLSATSGVMLVEHQSILICQNQNLLDLAQHLIFNKNKASCRVSSGQSLHHSDKSKIYHIFLIDYSTKEIRCQ